MLPARRSGRIIKTTKPIVCVAGLALALCVGAVAPCSAADKGGDGKTITLPSMQLGDYSIKLDTDEPRQPGVPDPSGLSTMRQDTPRAFLGLSLSRPLPDHFWNFVR
jgi:hypothetical protein